MGFKSLSALTFPLKIGPPAQHTLLLSFGCACGSVHIYVGAHAVKEPPHPPTIIRMSQSLPFHFSKKKKLVYKKIYLQKVTADSPTLCCFIFILQHPLSPPGSLSLPSLSPGPVCLPQQHFSSDKESLSCFPKQLQRAAISLSHLIWAFVFFQRKETSHGRVDSVPWNNNINKNKSGKLSCQPVSTILKYFGSIWSMDFFLRAVNTSGSHNNRLSSAGSFVLSSSWNASCSCLFNKQAANNPDRDHKTRSRQIYFSMLHILLENAASQLMFLYKYIYYILFIHQKMYYLNHWMVAQLWAFWHVRQIDYNTFFFFF